jgi:3-hydroxybutyryl-CoA dehydrogenase
MREITTVGVIGLGTMGAGIVEVFARGGLRVIGVETTQEYADRGRAILQASTDRAVARGRLGEDEQARLLDRVSVSTDLADLAPADLVVEAVPEVLAVKHEVLATLDGIVAEDAVLASNTSSLSITAIAAPTAYPRRVVGMHFFNPAPVLKLVEVITTVRTDPEVTDALVQLCDRLGKKPVVVGDRAGFVANYLLFGYFVSALRMLEQGHVSREDLDTAVRVGTGLPMGPCALMDLVGLDVCDHIGDVIYAHSRSPQHAPSAMLGRMVTAGWHGRKSGRGFYSYDRPGSATVVPDEATPPERTGPEPADIGPVVVLGDGDLAAELTSRLQQGGFACHALTDPIPQALAGRLTGAALVVDARTEPDEDTPETDGDLWQAVARETGPQTVLVSANPDAAVVVGALSGRPEKAAVLRVHAPTGNGQVVEIGRSVATDETTVALLRAVVRGIGAEPVVCRDRPGLVVDALLMPHLNDAVRMLDEGYAGVQDIDTALRYGLGYPAGPFAMIDAIGAQEVLAVCEELTLPGSGIPAAAAEPSALLLEHVLLDRPFTG